MRFKIKLASVFMALASIAGVASTALNVAPASAGVSTCNVGDYYVDHGVFYGQMNYSYDVTYNNISIQRHTGCNLIVLVGDPNGWYHFEIKVQDIKDITLNSGFLNDDAGYSSIEMYTPGVGWQNAVADTNSSNSVWNEGNGLVVWSSSWHYADNGNGDYPGYYWFRWSMPTHWRGLYNPWNWTLQYSDPWNYSA